MMCKYMVLCNNSPTTCWTRFAVDRFSPVDERGELKISLITSFFIDYIKHANKYISESLTKKKTVTKKTRRKKTRDVGRRKRTKKSRDSLEHISFCRFSKTHFFLSFFDDLLTYPSLFLPYWCIMFITLHKKITFLLTNFQCWRRL